MVLGSSSLFIENQLAAFQRLVEIFFIIFHRLELKILVEDRAGLYEVECLHERELKFGLNTEAKYATDLIIGRQIGREEVFQKIIVSLAEDIIFMVSKRRFTFCQMRLILAATDLLLF